MRLRSRTASLALAAFALVASPLAFADTVVYNNTTTDTEDTLIYSVGPYTEIGDQIHLGGTDRYATTATVQFYNNGDTAGTFDATLTLLNVGSPVGSVIGTYTVTNIAAPLGGVSGFNVDFTGLDTTVPDDLIFVVSVANQTGTLDLGLDLFEPPTVGSSDNTFLIVNDGSTYSTPATDHENVFFELQASTAPTGVPEPSTMVTIATALIILAAFIRARRRADGTQSK